jgi:hypothetical protein
MSIHSSRFEQTTALTDLALGLLASYPVMKLAPVTGFKSQIWMWAFALLAFASFIGVIAHGITMSQKANDGFWKPLNLSLGLALGLFVVGAVFDLSGEVTARAALPFMLALGVVFFLVTIIFPGTFLTFIVYEGIATIFALGVYVFLFYTNALPNAGWMALGVLVTIIAAVVQAAGQTGKSMLWYFDNNGMFHLIQMAGLLMLFLGLGIV